jgi:hypothetical protein
MKPEFIRMSTPAVVTHNGRKLAIVGGTRRHQPFEIRWWAFNLVGDIVVLERRWTDFVDSTAKELHRPCHQQILPLVMNCRWRAAFELGLHNREPVLDMNPHNGLFAF